LIVNDEHCEPDITEENIEIDTKLKFDEFEKKSEKDKPEKQDIIKIDIDNTSTPNVSPSKEQLDKDKTDKIDLPTFSQKEEELLKNDIQFAELYNLTLKHYSKEIYNPCKFFFINKFQMEKIRDDINKLLMKVCDFDEGVFKYNLEYLNGLDEKKILKEIQESCQNSNYRKLKYIFTHLRINPNFIYSDILYNLTYQTSFVDTRIESPYSGIQNPTSVSINLAGSNNSTIRTNQFIGQGSQNRINSTTNRLQNNNLLNMNIKDKICNFYTYLKNFRDKVELGELIKFLIEEYNYLPLKIESESQVEIKLGRDFEWKLNLNLI